MNRYIRIVFISSLLLVSLAGVSLADASSGYLLYLQGGGSSVVNGTGGAQMVTITDIIPYVYQKTGDTGLFLPASDLTNYSVPLNGALVMSGTDTESVSMVEISNISFSGKDQSLTFQMTPAEFYEGELLKSFTNESAGIPADNQGMKTTGLYLEIMGKTPDNLFKKWSERN